MADLANTYYFGTSASAPVIQYRISYTSTRTGVNTVSTNVKITILPLKYAQSYYGYNINARAEVGGVSGSTITVKGNSPRYWGSEFTVDLGTINNSGVEATATTLQAIVYVSSNSGRTSDTGFQTVTFPIGNTDAYWTSSKYCNVSPSGIIPENTSTLNVSWGGAKDDQGNTIYYITEFWANGVLTGYAGAAPTTATSGSVDISSYSQGSRFYFRTHCRDEYSTSSGIFGVQSATVIKNTLTPAKLSTGSSISFDSDSFYLTRNNATNTNGNTSFTYNLTCSGITVYNGNVTSLGTRITVSIYRSGPLPSGPYIKFSDLQSYTASSNYNRQLMFTLSTKNAYGSYRISSCYVQANLQKNPTTPSNLSITGHYTINNQNYYVVNRRGITFSWNKSTDPNNSTPIYYDVEMSIDGGTWRSYYNGLTRNSYTTSIMSRTSSGKLQFRVRARTKYGTVSDWLTSEELTIHYYYPPTLSKLSVDRADTSQTSSGRIEQYTSIPDITYNLTIKYNRGNSTIATQNPSMTDAYDFSYTQSGLSEADTFIETIAVSDNISSSVFNMSIPQSTGDLAIPRYASLLTIREKGVGINAVAGDSASFAVSGPVTMHGGGFLENDGSINISNRSDAYTYVWNGAYMDSEGVLRAAQDILPCQYFTQVQFYNNVSGAPVRYRNWWLTEEAVKDAPISPQYLPWVSLATKKDVDYALDHYPTSGTWIPEMGNCTFSKVNCTYYKIGKICHISGTWTFESYDNCTVQVTGLPFTPYDSYELIPCRFSDSKRGIYESCEQILGIYMRINGQFIYQHKCGNMCTVPCELMSNGSTVSINGVYRTKL